MAFPGSVLVEASSKKKTEPHRSPDVTESCWHITPRVNACDIFFNFVTNEASTYRLRPMVLLKSLRVKKTES